jgi:transcriptional regulator with XRE-family HTH domain
MSNVLTPTLCKTARTFLKWSQAELSEKAGVSLRSVTRFEDTDGQPSPSVRDKLYNAFIAGGLQFIATNSDEAELDGVGLRFKPRHPHSGIKLV